MFNKEEIVKKNNHLSTCSFEYLKISKEIEFEISSKQT